MPDSNERNTSGASPGPGRWSRDGLLIGDAPSLLAAAVTFKQSDGVQPLRGRHVAVLCEAAHSPSADVFTAAAAALGAAVVHLRPSSLRLSGRQSRRDTAHALGRLYAAIECDGVDESVMDQLARWSGVPVFDAVAAPTHPSWLLAAELTAREQAHEQPHEQANARDHEPAHAPAHAPANAPAQAPANAPPAVDPGAGPSPSLLQQQVENHRFVVQALLSHCIA